MKTLLIGADGQLGTDIVKAYSPAELVPLTIADLDVRNYDDVRRLFREYAPDVVINTSAYHRVDECEDYPERAMEVNALAVRNLALMGYRCISPILNCSKILQQDLNLT